MYSRRFFAILLLHNKDNNSRTIRSQVWQPVSAGKGADMSELQAHRCTTPELWTWLLCSVSVMPANKLIVRIKAINGYKAVNVRYSRKIWFLVPVSRGANAPLRTPMVLTYHEFKTVHLSSLWKAHYNSHSFRIYLFSNNVVLKNNNNMLQCHIVKIYLFLSHPC